MLIKCFKKDGQLQFEVCKEGLLRLKPFHHKKLRIIFNISHQSKDLDSFNNTFLFKQDNEDTSPQTKNEQQNLHSYLTVSSYHEELTDNRVIIFLNAYENKEEAQTSIRLQILGYVTASVFFYHNHHSLSDNSPLTNMLYGMNKCMKETEVLKLEQQITQKIGFSKKPYFMCIHNEQEDLDQENAFCSFYKYRQAECKTNEAIDLLIDYFSGRGGIQIKGKDVMERLRKEFIQKILGRKIFNFEITGLTLENLCFELCQFFNTGAEKIDLVNVYTKIITNQKIRVYDIAVQKYMNLSKKLLTQLPQEPLELQIMHHRNIQRFVIQESLTDASNCMEISEYQSVYERLVRQFEKRFEEIKSQNALLRRERTEKLYSETEDFSEVQENLQEPTPEGILEVIEVIQSKVDIFLEETIPEFTVRNLLSRMFDKFLQTLSTSFTSELQQKQNLLSEQTLRIESLEHENKKLDYEWKLSQIKMEKLEERIIDLTELKNKFQKKYSEKTEQQQFLVNSQILSELHRKNRQLQEEIAQKNAYIEQLGLILQNFEVEFNKKYYKPKFSKKINSLLNDVTHKVNDVHVMMEELKKTQNFYDKIKKDFEKKKEKIDEERANDKKQLAMERAKFEKIQRQKDTLDSVIEQARSAIKVMKNVEEQLKESIQSLEHRLGILSCLNATSEQKLSDFRQGLQLTCEYVMSGKGDRLKKFLKVTETEEVPSIICKILKK